MLRLDPGSQPVAVDHKSPADAGSKDSASAVEEQLSDRTLTNTWRHVTVTALSWLAVLGIACWFVGYNTRRLSDPFGPSHDGFNGALYLTGGRAIVEDGPVRSRWGAVSATQHGDRVVYAHHPPLVYVYDAAALAAAGSAEVAGRLPALVSSLTVLALLPVLLSACGVSPGAAAVGLLFAFATPMFMLFGATTEPHALGLAPMTALSLIWQRTRHGGEASLWTVGLVAVVATLTSWQAALLAASVAVVLLFNDRQRSAAFAAAAGVAVGSLLVAAWMLWAYDGDLREFAERAVHRSGVGGRGQVTFAQMASQQGRYLADLFPIGGPLVLAIAAVGVFDSRTRAVVAVSLGTVVAYAALFRNGAYDHNYWLYAVLLPLALGAAVTAEAASRWLWRYAVPGAMERVAGFGIAAILVVTLSEPSGEERQRQHAAAIGAQARALQWPSAQRYAYHAFGGRGYTDLLPWLRFYSRLEPFGVDGPQSVPQGNIMLRLVDGALTAVAGEQEVHP